MAIYSRFDKERGGMKGGTAARLYTPPPKPRHLATVLGFGSASIVIYLVNHFLNASTTVAAGGIPVSPWAVSATVVVLAVQAVALRWRISDPIPAFVAIYVCYIVVIFTSGDRDLVAGATLWFMIFSLSTRGRDGQTALVLGAAALFDVLLQMAFIFSPLSAFDPITGPVTTAMVVIVIARVVASYGILYLAGIWFGTQRQRTALASQLADVLQREQEVLQREQDARVEAALALERNQMARELHDLAAHHLTGIIVQTKAALRVHESAPAKSEDLTEMLESTLSEARVSLENLRAVVAFLRHDGDDNDSSSAPTLDRLPELIGTLRQVAKNMSVHTEGRFDDLPATVSLACFRIIQESIANSNKHSPGASIEVRATRRSNDVIVEITNTKSTFPDDGSFASENSGYGVLGMQERATLLGGRLTSGRTDSGGWATRANIPINQEVMV